MVLNYLIKNLRVCQLGVQNNKIKLFDQCLTPTLSTFNVKNSRNVIILVVYKSDKKRYKVPPEYFQWVNDEDDEDYIIINTQMLRPPMVI